MNRAVQVYEQLQERPGHKNQSCRMPYSVSDELFSLIAGHIQSNTSQYTSSGDDRRRSIAVKLKPES